MVRTVQRVRSVERDVDLDALDKQRKFYTELKSMGVKKLRDLHKKTFAKTKWWHEPPRGVDRKLLKEWLIRRIWMYFAVKNYHFPKGSDFRSNFVKRAKHVLADRLDLSDDDTDGILAKKIKQSDLLSHEGIATLSDEEVDKVLIQYGVNFTDDIPSEQRRFALWELYNKAGSKTLKTKPASDDKRGEKQVAARQAKAKGKGMMRDFIIQHPHLSFSDFQKKAGKKFPTTTRSSYAMTKSVLRSEGWSIPVLDRSGESAPNKGPAKKRAAKKAAKKSKKRTTKKSTSKRKAAHKPTRTVVKGVTVKKKSKKAKRKKK